MKKLDINNRRYLGSKYKLLDFIDDIVEENCGEYNTVLDVFAGTGIVANHFNEKGKTVYVNDILKSNCYIYDAFFGTQKVDISKIDDIIESYNNIQEYKENYFWEVYKDTYFSSLDCMKIGTIREDIEEKYRCNEINDREKSILIGSLIYSMDRIANTVGHYDAYRKLDNIQDKFEMFGLNVKEENANQNKIFNADANQIISDIKEDILYIDPPYNSRQYGDAYHLLENIAEWKQPKVYGVAKKMNRDNLKSDYCTNKATVAFKNLIENSNAKYILVSYNNMGKKGNARSQAKISDTEILEILNKKGNVKVYEKDFSYFTTGKSKIDNHKERIFFCDTRNNKTNNDSIWLEGVAYDIVKSPLNYVGGKYKLLDQLMPRFPENIETFFDFFCGGANVGVNVLAKKTIGIDSEKNLVNVLNLFKKYKYGEIVEKLDDMITQYGLSNSFINGYQYYGCDSSKGLGTYNKDSYIRLRNDYNHYLENDDEKTFMFLLLIIYGFNHQIRFNSEGKFNMPVGKRDFNASIRKNLLNFCDKINSREIEFISKDFRNIDINTLDENDFCYFDPPYLLGDACYNENNNWTTRDEKELLQYIKDISDRNIKFAFSNVIEHKGKKNDILINWAIENKYNINYLNYNYNNSNYQNKNKSGITTEVLITNY